jgi:hypothetical protein
MDDAIAFDVFSSKDSGTLMFANYELVDTSVD